MSKIMFMDKEYSNSDSTVITIPIASKTTLGGIKVGNGLEIAVDGTLSVHKEQLKELM